jgi:hypothetical protein
MVTDSKDHSEEAQRLIERYINPLNQLFQEPGDEPHKCIFCQQAIERLEQHGRCIYAAPCGCRLYQGIVPDWARSKDS